MKKLYLVILLALYLLCFTVACGKSDDTNTKDTGSVTETKTEAQTKAVTEATTEAQTEIKTEAKTETKTEANTEAMTEKKTENGGNTAGDAPELLYQGHASVRITTPEGKVIYVDPFFGEGYDVPADLILMTHAHNDHTKANLIQSKTDDFQMITWRDALVDGQHQAFDLGYVKIEAVEAGYNVNHNEKQCVGYILTFTNGATLYLSGDTSTTPQMSELAGKNLDYAFFCCDGVYNMDVAEASKCAQLVAAKHSIPYHMIPADKPDGFDQSVAESFDAQGRIILKPGETLSIVHE